MLKEAEIGNFNLVDLELEEGWNAGEKVHYVGKILSIEDDSSYNVSFLRLKSKFGIPDTFCFPLIEDTAKVSRESSKGVLVPRQGSTQRLSNIVKLYDPLFSFNMKWGYDT